MHSKYGPLIYQDNGKVWRLPFGTVEDGVHGNGLYRVTLVNPKFSMDDDVASLSPQTPVKVTETQSSIALKKFGAEILGQDVYVRNQKISQEFWKLLQGEEFIKKATFLNCEILFNVTENIHNQLQEIIIEKCDFNGIAWNSFINLPNLKTLTLKKISNYSNESELSGISSLEDLTLESIALEDNNRIDLSLLKANNLRSLVISKTNAYVPSEMLLNFPFLKAIYIDDNEVLSSIHFPHGHPLKTLFLSQGFKGELKDLPLPLKIEELYISAEIVLTERFFMKLPSGIKALGFRDNQSFTHKYIRLIPKNIAQLDLAGVPLSSGSLKSLMQLKKLNFLDIDYASFTGREILDLLNNLPMLKIMLYGEIDSASEEKEIIDILQKRSNEEIYQTIELPTRK